MISMNYVTFPYYLPRIIRSIRNWPLYCFNYVTRRKQSSRYYWRNGLCLIDATGTLVGTIAVVFIRREYGTLYNLQTIVDIGANMGAFSIYAAAISPKSRIYCYEPEEHNFEFLKENVRVNSLENRVSVFKKAVGSNSGERDLIIGESPIHSFFKNTTEAAHQTVECTTLKEIFETHGLHKIDLLKVNCEGAEYEILEGCEQIYYDRIVNIRMEYHNINSEKQNGKYMVKLLKSKGYEIERFSSYQGESGFIWARRKSNGF